MDDLLWINETVAVPTRELQWRFSRAGGPGGQGVNTTDSRVQVRWDLAHSPSLPPVLRERALTRLGGRLNDGVLAVSASSRRSQLLNRQLALARLVALLREAIAPPGPMRRPATISPASQRRRVEAKRRRSSLKQQRRRPPLE